MSRVSQVSSNSVQGAPVRAAALAPAPAPGVSAPVDSWQGTPAPAVPAPPGPAPATDAPATGAPLTAEEQGLLAAGLLPTNYAELKLVSQTKGVEAAKALYREGKQGPFSESYGDINVMLAGARRMQQNPELLKLFKDTKKGDLIAIDYNSSTDVIASATHGPFAHVIVCTDEGPPPDFIEAVGVTGDQKDPSCNKVRRSWAYEHFYKSFSYRRLTPAAGLAEPRRSQAIADAVTYCEHQLGKPYDYTFGENGVGRSFYCSSLGYYAYVKGAGLPIQLRKSADRDALMLALDSMVDALGPKDRAALMDEAARKINGNPKPTMEELVSFIVQRVLPECSATAGIAKTPADRQHLQTVIDRFRSGQGLPRFVAASDAAAKADKAGAYKTPVIGPLRRLWDRTCIGMAAVLDVYHAYDGSGMSRWQTIRATRRLLFAFLPYSEAISAFIFGKQDGRTRLFGRVLDTTAWLREHRPFSWVTGWLPVRGTNAVDGRFISPTDLAWANLAHEDYSVRPGQNLGRNN